MNTKNYIMDSELVNEIVEEMYEGGDGICGIDEIVRAVCGDEFYGKWDKEELEYVKEVMREFCRINVEFNEDESFMSIESEVDEDEE